MIDHSSHAIDKYGVCGQFVQQCWVPDYKWWYVRKFAQAGFALSWDRWSEARLLPVGAVELAGMEPEAW